MKKTNTNAIVFAQAEDSKKAVVATRNGKEIYLAWALKQENEKVYNGLGGKRREGVKYFCVDFPTVKNAKEFIAKAITHIDADEYAKARKTEPKAKADTNPKKVAPTTAKGKKTDDLVTVTLVDGTQLQVSASALGIKTEPKKAPRKSKGDKPTTAPNAKASKKAEKVATPRKNKGNCPVDFSVLAGKGKAANKEAAALMRAAGYTNGTTDEYKAVWAEWCKVR